MYANMNTPTCVTVSLTQHATRSLTFIFMLHYQYLKVYTNSCVHINITLTLTCTFTFTWSVPLTSKSYQKIRLKLHLNSINSLMELSTLLKYSQRCKAERVGWQILWKYHNFWYSAAFSGLFFRNLKFSILVIFGGPRSHFGSFWMPWVVLEP